MFVVQIVLNNLMKHYGELTSYGSDIPLACIGVVMKINMIFMAIVIGVGQGTQPIISYNYGAKSYKRCKETYMAAAKINVAISVFFFILFQIFPSQLLSMFGNGTPEYIEFGVLCFRIYLFMTFINGLQPLTSIFFTSIGKAIIGGFIALTRQIIFLLPLAVILPKFMGIKGIMYAAPIADLMACVLVFVFMIREFRLMSRESVKKA
jgi:Na+-driven multidrug efflux pump